MEQVMPLDPPVDEIRSRFAAWIEEQGRAAWLDPDAVKAYGLANPLGMSADGLQRYWRKFRAS